MRNEEAMPPDVTEAYTSATHASNLRVEIDADRRSSADVLMAAAWSPSRLGGALLRLHSEFDGAQHPRRMTPAAISAYAQTIAPVPGLAEKEAALDQITRARVSADEWHRHEVMLLLGRLKTLPEVRNQLTLRAQIWGVFQPEDVAVAVLIWWLDPICKGCNGIKFELIKETPVKSTKPCKCCRGSGEASLPYKEEGRRMANYIDDCIQRARDSMKNRLRKFPHHG